ncbi:MAG: DUF429 domain-containing protein [Chloroflexi bacterium]|nr:DUF429 domain-containing protein [Chloroflexota bacterium]
MAKMDRSSLRSPGDVEGIHGVDFSGARNAGAKIWIASCTIVGDVLVLEDCRPAETLPDSARNRDRCLAALREFISAKQKCAFGLDFPFGLPRDLVKASNWEQFVLSFGKRYPDPKEFWRASHSASDGHEWKRVTDKNDKTPFSPYNLRLYRQTYYGIRGVLAPLVQRKSVHVLPMQGVPPGSKPWLLEVCPASTLIRMELRVSYKGRAEKHPGEKSLARAIILKRIESTGAVSIPAPALRGRVLEDYHGDALDSVIAAFATFRAIKKLARSPVSGTDADMIEGHVYV